MKVTDLLSWIRRDFYRYSGEEHVDVLPAKASDSGLVVKLYTDVNVYTLTARDGGSDGGYLGAVGGSRKPRAGETWTRGNDLSDGPLSEETWSRIKNDIISFELVRLRRNHRGIQDTPSSSRVLTGKPSTLGGG